MNTLKRKLFKKNCLISQYLSLLLLVLIALISSCDDDVPEPKIFETGTVTDVQGNVYKTVKIGNQWWMAEDLKVTAFRSGLIIETVAGNEDWAATTAPACISFQGAGTPPGLLYNYHVVSGTEQVAPEGWHVPTDEEWKELESYLGLPSAELDQTNWRGTNQGDMLKVEGSEGWTSYEGVWATNESGFSAFGGSSRFYEGPFGVPGLKGSAFYWTATTSDSGLGWYRYLDYKKSGVFRYAGHPNYGFSIRCVKD